MGLQFKYKWGWNWLLFCFWDVISWLLFNFKISVQWKFNCITVNFDRTQHGIYVSVPGHFSYCPYLIKLHQIKIHCVVYSLKKAYGTNFKKYIWQNFVSINFCGRKHAAENWVRKLSGRNWVMSWGGIFGGRGVRLEPQFLKKRLLWCRL